MLGDGGPLITINYVIPEENFLFVSGPVTFGYLGIEMVVVPEISVKLPFSTLFPSSFLEFEVSKKFFGDIGPVFGTVFLDKHFNSFVFLIYWRKILWASSLVWSWFNKV